MVRDVCNAERCHFFYRKLVADIIVGETLFDTVKSLLLYVTILNENTHFVKFYNKILLLFDLINKLKIRLRQISSVIRNFHTIITFLPFPINFSFSFHYVKYTHSYLFLPRAFANNIILILQMSFIIYFIK